eukprot:SAG31_NODE_2744_length_5150_cov_4.544249_8_plen_102_part_00
MFEGEQHGFRVAANIRRALDTELEFYGKVFGPPELIYCVFIRCSYRLQIRGAKENNCNMSSSQMVAGFLPDLPPAHTPVKLGDKVVVPLVVEQEADAEKEA